MKMDNVYVFDITNECEETFDIGKSESELIKVKDDHITMYYKYGYKWKVNWDKKGFYYIRKQIKGVRKFSKVKDLTLASISRSIDKLYIKLMEKPEQKLVINTCNDFCFENLDCYIFCSKHSPKELYEPDIMEHYDTHRRTKPVEVSQDMLDSDRIFCNQKEEYIIKYFNTDMLLSSQNLGSNTLRICVLDTETTGTNLEFDEVIELALTILDYDVDISSYKYIDTISWLRCPSIPITENIEELTGLTYEELTDNTIPINEILSYMDKCNYVIAHKVSFDFPMLRKVFGNKLDNYNWRCSLIDIDWESYLGYSSRSLYSLALEHGIYYNGHRASIDTQILSYILTRFCKTGSTYLDLLINKEISTKVLICVRNPPYGVKTIINDVGLNKWYPPLRCWWSIIDIDNVYHTKEILSNNLLDIEEIQLEHSERFLSPIELLNKLTM